MEGWGREREMEGRRERRKKGNRGREGGIFKYCFIRLLLKLSQVTQFRIKQEALNYSNRSNLLHSDIQRCNFLELGLLRGPLSCRQKCCTGQSWSGELSLSLVQTPGCPLTALPTTPAAPFYTWAYSVSGPAMRSWQSSRSKVKFPTQLRTVCVSVSSSVRQRGTQPPYRSL